MILFKNKKINHVYQINPTRPEPIWFGRVFDIFAQPGEVQELTIKLGKEHVSIILIADDPTIKSIVNFCQICGSISFKYNKKYDEPYNNFGIKSRSTCPSNKYLAYCNKFIVYTNCYI